MPAKNLIKFVFLAGFSCLFASISWANSAPTDINASNLTIAENSAIGTLIGEFNATDPDGDTNITFSLVPPLPSDLNISLWLDASDSSTITHSNGSVSQWSDKSGNDHDANQSNVSNQPTLQQNTINGKPAILFDGSNDFIAGQSRLALPVNPAISVFIVCKPIQHTNTDDRILQIGGNSYSLAVSAGSDGWAWRYTGGNEVYSTVNLSSENLLTFVRPAGGDFSSASFFIYGIEQTSTNGVNDNGVPSNTESVYTIGSKFGGNDWHYNGTIGEIIVTDSDSNEIRQKTEGYLAQKWGLGANLPSSHPFKNDSSLFSLDANGSLTANQIFDFETIDRNYSITVFATDDHNATFDKNFTITLTNVVEDLDGDGIEDHNDTDIDGDGLTNAEELAYNSDPWDASSSNRPPSDINASNLTIAENSAIGTVIGEFNATDPDGEGNFTYELVNRLPSDLNLSLWLDASDFSTITETNGSVSQWADKSGNENHAVQETDSRKPTFSGSDALLNYKPTIKSNSQDGKIGLSIQSTSLQEIFIVAYYKDGIDSNFDRYNTLISGSGSNGAYRVMGKINSASWYSADVFNNAGSFQNGSVESSTNALPMPATLLRLKSSVLRVDSTGVLFNPDWNDRGWVGGIGEILGLPAITTTDQRETIEAYLASKWGLLSNLPSEHPAKTFSVDTNGTLTANQIFDYETDDRNYSIIVRVTDDHNVSFDKNFTVSLTNIVEDLDGDGTEDYYDDDIDGDGLTNVEELAYNSDPWDASSSNRPPSDINASNLTIAENSAIGTVIGEFNATDPDGDGNFSYELVPQLPSDLNISLWLDASDASTITHSNGFVSKWADKSGNNRHAIQITDAKKPLYSEVANSFLFDGSNDYMSIPGFNPHGEFSIYIVFSNERETLASSGGVVDVVAAIGPSSGSGWTIESYNTWGTRSLRRLYLYGVGTSSKTFLNGTQTSGEESKNLNFNQEVVFSARVNSSHANGPFTLGAYSNLAYYGENEIREILVSSEVHNEEKRYQVEGYLAQKWALLDHLSSDVINSFLFSFDKNGTLSANQTFDYETDDLNYSITVRATDDHNISFDKNFTITVTNVVEDLDGDGTEDYYDDDIDGDGLSNAEELLYNSDPWNASSSNRPPSDINTTSNLTIAENSAIGTVIGEFNATDPDGEGNFTFTVASIIKEPNFFPEILPELTAWFDASDTDTLITTHGGNELVSWANKVNPRIKLFGAQSRSPTTGASINQLNAVMFDESSGVTELVEADNWNPATEDGSISGDVVDLSIFLAMRVDQNARSVFPFGFGWGDHFFWKNGGIYWRNSEGRPGFVVTTNGERFVLNLDFSVTRGTQRVFKNGVELSSGPRTEPTKASHSFHFPSSGGGGVGEYLQRWSVGEVIVARSLLSDELRQRTEGYLTHKWGLVESLPSSHLFSQNRSVELTDLLVSIDENGTLSTRSVPNYEADQNYTITVRATDDHNVSFDKNFTITLTNVIEDLDGDGTEDHYDLDDDGDGLSDLDEVHFNSDPRDANSPAVPATSFVISQELNISEDAEIGAVVGKFTELEASASPIKSYELIPHLPTSANPVLWLDASELDYAGETWHDKSLSNNHATRNGSAQGFPTVFRNYQNGHSVIHYNGAPKSYHDFHEIGDVRTVFWVVGRSSGSGSLLGDSDSSQFFSGTDQFWLNGLADSKVISGDTFLRGRKIDGSSTPIPSSLEVISFRSSADLNASRFGRSSNGRAFVGELGELIIFNQALANWQMAQIERYLAQKWSLPIVRSASEFSIDAEGVVRSAIKFNFDDTSSRSLLVRATNENNQSVINSHVVAITDGAGGASVSDIDGDGMSNELERSLGYDPYDANSKNTTPTNLRSSNNLEILESISVGSVVGSLIADDPDYLSELTFSLTSGEGAGDNSKLSISEGGEIKLLASLDYEKQISLSFRAKVVDENNASIEKAFTLSVIDVFEDENNNGVEDHLESDMDGDGIPNESDPDRDGDGVSNEDELQNGSDPDNAKSTNRSPTDLVNSSALSIQENQPKGAVISKFIPQDPDGVQGYSYLLVEGTGATDNGLFEIDQHGNLSTAVVFDYENNASSYSVRIKGEDPYGKSVEKAFSIALTNSDQFSPISIDADLMLWLDASDQSTLDKSTTLGGAGQPKDGEAVKFWADKSGQGHHAITSNSGTYLENSLNEYYPSIDTTGDTFELVNSAESFDAWSEMTIFFVHIWSQEYSWQWGIKKGWDGTAGWVIERLNVGASQGLGLKWARPENTSTRLNGSGATAARYEGKVICMRYDGSSTNLKYFANGRFIKDSNETEPSFVSNLSDTLKIGNSYKWGEVLIYKNALPDTKRELIEGYLAHKWGMDSELGDEHPFYENPVVAGYESYEANFSNRAPSDLFLESNNQVTEGKTIGTVINTIGVVDPDISNSFLYALVAGEGDEQNSFFKLSEDGELITSKAIDYEQHTELSLRVKVSDDHNQSFSKALTITVLNVVEDADNDGIEDHEDPSIDTDQDGIEDSEDSDIDGDGMSNSEEITNGSDPRDANSINHAPSSISSNGTLSFRENEPAGILVGQLSAVDQDDGASHQFFLVAGEGDTDNSFFTLSESGELRTAQTFDYEKNASSYSIRVQARDQYLASAVNSLTIELEDDRWLTPDDLGDNLMLWLDATDYQSMESGDYHGDLGIPATDSFINIWGDRSGNQHHARAITSMPKFKKSGLNGKPTVQFTNDTMKVDNSKTAFNNWSEISLFMVWQTKSWNTWTPLFGKTNSNNTTTDATWYFLARRPDLSPPYYRWQINGESSSSSPEISTTYSASIKSPNLLVLTYDGSHAKAWLNGNLAFNTSYSGGLRATEYPFTLGGSANEIGSATIEFSEVVIFQQSLTDEKRIHLESSLAHKWALQSRFPSTYPHRNRLTLNGGFVVVEEQAIGTTLGRISEVSADYNASHTYSLSEANSTNHNHLFSMDENGTLTNLAVFDYETNATEYKISVRSSINGTLVSEKTYPVLISDADEDLDGDGFSNAEETAYGSDPEDKDSIPNGEPTNITGSLSVAENAEIGTVVGTVSTVDPDNHDTYSYSIVSRSSSSNIRLWLDANDSNSILQKDGKVYEWRDLSGRGNHAKQQESSHQPALVEDRIQFDGNDILQVRDDALRHGIPGLIAVAKWDASVSWGNTIAGYQGESGIGWKLRQYSSSFNKLTFTSFGTTGGDNPNPSQTTTQSDYFICSSFREDGFRYLRHNGEAIIKFEDKNYINYPGSDYGKSGIGGYFGGKEYSNPNGFLRGSIKELIVYAGKKQSHEIDRIERYLANKWGIEVDGPIDELNNEEFSIDGDGVVKTKVALDFEEDANRTIRIRATDPYGEFIEKELVVSLSNVVEDIDGDGIEDAIDEDADGDGINNETELDNGSDPYDAQSKNQLPTGISASGTLTVSENADAGTSVGNFTGTDPDAGQSLKFRLVAEYPHHLSPSLWLDANASETIDLNRSYIMKWGDKRGGPSLIQDEESRQPQMTDLELNDLPVVEFFGNDYMYSNGVFPLSPTFTMFAVAGFDWVNSASDSLVSYDSFSGGGFMQWDAGDAHRFKSRVWHHSNSGSLTSHKFYPQSDMGPALYQVSFDYEKGTIRGLLNGQSLGKTDYQTPPHPRHVLRLFANNALNQFPKGFVGEFMVFEEALSEMDRKLVESYLGEKWALPMHDPIEHPLFKMEQNGTLVTREELDFETDENHTITVRVFDEYNATYDKEFLVSVTNIVEDLDGDGIENHYDTDDDNDSIPDELDPDDDNDGFSDADEFAYGSDPLDPNSVANAFPNFLDLNGTTIFENQPIGTRVGQLIAHDPDGNALLVFRLVDGNGSDDNSLFVIDENASVRTTTIFDYETDDHNYSIRVGVADEHNFSIERSFTINLLNIVEDNDQDGVEDHYDTDDDNDGFSDLDEQAYGSDPLDPNSVANAFPNILDLNGTTILENQPKGTIIGQLIGYDPDPNATMVFSFVDGNGSDDNALFEIDENASVRTTTIFDYETDEHNYSIRVRVADEHNFSIDRPYTINLLNVVEDNDQDGVEDHYDPDDDNDGFSDAKELAYGSDPFDPNSVANAAPNSLELNSTTILENQPKGTIFGRLIGHDPDTNAKLVYSQIFDSNKSQSPVHVDLAGVVRTTRVFDYETNEHNYTLVAQVSDEHNFSIERSFTIQLLDQNEPPYDLNSTTSLRVLENQPVGTMVGKLTAKDQDEGDQLTYKLVRDREQIANEFFTLDENGTLRTAVVLDYEKNASLFIRARVTDKGGLLTKNGFVVEVINVIEDLDGDGTEDAYDKDIDGDGFTNADELAYGSNPMDSDSVANAAPNSLDLNGTTIEENQPKGTIIGRLIGHDPDTNAKLVYSQVFEGNQTQSPVHVGPSGVVRTTRIFDYEIHEHNYTLVAKVSDDHNFSIERSVTIHLLNQIEDMDKDGVEDFYDKDIDGDGFSNRSELAYGSDPLDSNSVANAAPDFLDLNGTTILENQPKGTIIGRLIGHDPDTNATLVYSQILEGNQTQSPVFVGPAGVVRTTRIFDYEIHEHNYTLVAKVSDDHNFSIERSFTVHLLNQIEDMDKDGVEDFYDKDIDGDGFSNRSELAYGSDPFDPNSMANTAPDFLELNGTTILENQPKGTIIGRLIGHDPDTNAKLVYSQVLEGNQTQSLVHVGPAGFVRTTRMFDYETNEHNFTLVARVMDEHNFSIERSFTIHLLNQIEDLDKDGEEDFYDEDIDGDGFTNLEELNFGSDPLDPQSVINREPEDITMIGGRIRENEPVRSVVARFFGVDADGNESLTFSLIEYTNEWDFHQTEQKDDTNESFSAIEDSYDRNDSQFTAFNSTSEEISDEKKTDEFYITNDSNSSLSPSSQETIVKEFKYLNPFVLSPRGVLRTNRILDFETEPSIHFVTIRAVDDYNESIDRNFSIRLINVIEDEDEDGTEDAYDDDIDGDGFSNAEEIHEGTNPRDQYSSPKKPILFTNDASNDENGSFILSGGVLTNGQGSISDFGFVLSPKISVDDDSLWIRGIGKPRDFTLLIDKLPFEPVMYFRAWAKNIAGYGIGPVKKVRMEEAPQPWWGEVDERPGNWMSSNWFGNFKYYEQGWLYHGRLGWLYSSPAEGNSVWLWKEGRGWLWTKESAWPYLWWVKRKDWLYLVPGKVGQPPRFYDYSTQSY